jgi:peroxiredoxin
MFAGRAACLLVAIALAAEPANAGSMVGRPIEGFTLADQLGSEHSLHDWQNKRAIVVVFVGTECPLVARYAQRLSQLAEKYQDSATQFVCIDSNQQDSLAELAKFVRVHKLTIPVLKDPDGHVADLFGAQRTPEAFVLDAERVVRYHGAIDDQFGVGYSRAAATEDYLGRAIGDVLADRTVEISYTAPVGCRIGRPNRREPRGDVTYSNHVSRIFQKRCTVCHREGEIAPFSLLTYKDAADWSETIREVIEEQRMPPWHANPEYGEFSNDARLSDEEKRLIFEWIDNGMPEGDAAQLPAPLDFAEGWRIPNPDLVVRMPKPFVVPASGIVEYQYFIVDPGFKQDMWVRKAEGRPGNRSVVHHMILFHIPPGQELPKSIDALKNSVGSFAPGAPATELPDGAARRIPAGSKLVFQMHYTPNGTEQTDQSEVGLVFADPSTVKREFSVGWTLNWTFLIPPGAKDYRVKAAKSFEHDTLIYSMVPHMHMRGKSFRFTAIDPDGESEILLDIPNYDFNWQNVYRLAKPRLMRAGSTLECVAHYDNSEDNLANPDPKQVVRWGEQSSDEMMIGSFYCGPAGQDLTLGPPRVTPVNGERFEAAFRFKPQAAAQTIHLAGTFNSWKRDEHPMSGPDHEGWYTAKLEVGAGEHEYMFLLDGKTWKPDPGNRLQSAESGNSLLVIGK